jgi:putative flavoprotein involved in K+ transport
MQALEAKEIRVSTTEATERVEAGATMQLARRSSPHARPMEKTLDVIVIGGGQAGLSVGYHLARTGSRFVILDANERVGDSWRNRWASLRLFSPAKFDGLDGMRFPAHGNYFPTKDEMADYLEAYARRFELPVRNGVRVERLFKRGAHYVVQAGSLELEAKQVVVAMAPYQRAEIPGFAAELSRDLTTLHSMDYRVPRQLRPGGVLLVGSGNSAADIALEVAREGHPTWISGRDTGEVPYRPEGFLGRNVFGPILLGFVFRHVLTVKTPLGRKARPAILAKGAPRIRVKGRDLAAAGVLRVPRVVGARQGLPLLADGSTLSVSNVIWCSGYHPGFDWIDLPVFDDHGEPKHQSGIVKDQPGLYFVGLTFLHAMSSSMIHGVGRDAARVAQAIRFHAAAGHGSVELRDVTQAAHGRAG